jgi:hypothetical protein
VGPPGFVQLDSGPDGVQGALQQRRDLVDVPTSGNAVGAMQYRG